jgi:OmpA-OmpF porin, OOP family
MRHNLERQPRKQSTSYLLPRYLEKPSTSATKWNPGKGGGWRGRLCGGRHPTRRRPSGARPRTGPIPWRTVLESNAGRQGEQSGSQLLATSVKFRSSALNTANQIQAGLQPTDEELKATQEEQKADEQKIQQQQLAAQNQQIQASQQKIVANQQQIEKSQAEQAAMSKRFGELGDYDTKATATVYFAVNSSAVNAKGKQDLQALATQAKQVNAYMIQVAGYTDSSGNAAYNQQLSDKRAADVIAYLQQSCGVPLFRVLAPAAMGMSHAATTSETPSGMSENRRVVVKILVNKGLSGQ